jgi:hypothetical protein
MSEIDKSNEAVSIAINSLKTSEYGSDEYHMAYKVLISLLIDQIDLSWEFLKNDFFSKKELLFFDIIDRLVDLNHDDIEYSETPEIIAKVIMADSELVEYCKAVVGVKNTYPFEIKFQIQHKLNLIHKAIVLCQ